MQMIHNMKNRSLKHLGWRLNAFRITLIIAIGLHGCGQEVPLTSNSVLSTAYKNDIAHSELDLWIKEKLTKPYNISVEYRWEKHTSQNDSYSYPPREEQIKPFLEAVLQLAIEPFAELFAQNNLFQRVSPLRMYLYGGHNIHPIGIELVRNNDAPAVEMHLYGVDDFDPTDEETLFALARSVYHQMMERLTEVIPYDADAFGTLSEGRYKASIGFVHPFLSELHTRKEIYGFSPYSLREGFFTLYSMVSQRDEFAEILSVFFATTLSERMEAYNIASKYATDPNDPAYGEANKKKAEKAVAMLHAKEEMVKKYLSEEVKVPLIRIQRKLHLAKITYIKSLSMRKEKPEGI